MKTTSKTLIRLYALERLILWNFVSKLNGSVLISEFPKSGGTWISSMIANYLDLPFPRNTSRPTVSRSVMLGHLRYRSSYNNPLVVVRDVRDVYVSFYYHHLFPNDWNHHPSVRKHREFLNFSDFDDITRNFPSFVEYIHEHWGKQRGHFTWASFVDHWLNYRSATEFIRYERMLSEPAFELPKALMQLRVTNIDEHRINSVIEKFSFKKITGRTPGHENTSSFARKGVAGDWVNSLDSRSREVIDHYCGRQLIALGYENDNRWRQVQS